MPGVSRRDAMAIAAAAPLAARGAREVFAAEDPVRFGLIGCGRWGQTLLGYLNRIPTGRCLAVCDPHPPHRDKAVGISRDRPASLAGHRELLGRSDLEAVLVAAPLHKRFAIARDALLAGKHVFCEPTLVFTAAEVHDLRMLAGERSDQVFQTGFQHRYSRFYQLARQMVSKGFLGEVTHIQAQWHQNPGWAMAPDDGRGRETNWKLLREFSGGLTSELACYAIDVASWMFNAEPESVLGAGGLQWRRDGRDVNDNIALIFNYPEGRRMVLTCVTTNKHLSPFGGARTEAGEVILGTEGTIEITRGVDGKPPLGLWYYEPGATEAGRAPESEELAKAAGATMGSAREGFRPMPILLDADQFTGEENFLQRELKWARRWLYSKGVLVPSEDRGPVEMELDGFFDCCRSGDVPKADAEDGLNNAAAVILANLAMEQHREVRFTEFETTAPRPVRPGNGM